MAAQLDGHIVRIEKAPSLRGFSVGRSKTDAIALQNYPFLGECYSSNRVSVASMMSLR